MQDVTHIELSIVNASEGYRIHDDVLAIEDLYVQDSLFKTLQREYGRCTSKVYIDSEYGTHPVGWVFEKRVKYDDVNETYLQETWVNCLKMYDPRPRKEYATI